MSAAFEPFFSPTVAPDGGRRFCVWHAPSTANGGYPAGLIVHVHAFAEEMNKSRRMVAQQARALAASGWGVLLLDLFGCGDSDGDFGQANWNAWVRDVHFACELALRRWIDSAVRTEPPQLWLWGHRAGCLLATEARAGLPDRNAWNLLFWQPSLAGKTVLQQFLRLEAAGALLGRPQQSDQPSAKKRLASQQSAEVSGYVIHPALATGLERARLTPPDGAACVHWLEVSPDISAASAPATQSALLAWSTAGWKVSHHRVVGPAFWQTTEIEDAPALIAGTVRALSEPTPQPAPTADARLVDVDTGTTR